MFETALKKTLEHEGGYANVSGDYGKETYKGISRRFFPDWRGWKIVDRAKSEFGGSLPHNYHIKNPELDKLVKDFYYTEFWKPFMIDQIHDRNLQELIFDIVVNSRNRGVREIIQTTLMVQFNQNIALDGYIGNETISAINRCNAKQLFDALIKSRENYYRRLAEKYPSQAKFLKGWLHRTFSFNYVASISAAAILIVAIAGYLIYKNYTA